MPSLARSVPKPLKVPSLARSVPKPFSIFGGSRIVVGIIFKGNYNLARRMQSKRVQLARFCLCECVCGEGRGGGIGQPVKADRTGFPKSSYQGLK